MTRKSLDNNENHGFSWWAIRLILLAIVITAIFYGFFYLFAGALSLTLLAVIALGLLIVVTLGIFTIGPIIITILMLLLPISILVLLIAGLIILL